MVTPRSSSFRARPTTSSKSWSSTEIRAPTGFPGWQAATVMPEEVRPLNSASVMVRPIPRTSPVDFISGPRRELASVSFSKENTGTLTQK